MKAADIPDETFLAIVREYNEGRAPDHVSPERVAWEGTSFAFVIPESTTTGPRWALTYDLEDRLPDFPHKVILAKARSLIRRGLLEGCPCGCRGDFELPEYAYRGPDEIARAIAKVETHATASA